MKEPYGHGSKLSRKMDLAIAALLTQPTVPAAAKAAGIGDVTLWRWLQVPVFQEHYRAARRQVVEHAVAEVQGAATEAVATLRRNLTSGVPAVEVSAARAILDLALRGVELLDLEQRLAALEEMATPAEGRPRRWA